MMINGLTTLIAMMTNLVIDPYKNMVYVAKYQSLNLIEISSKFTYLYILFPDVIQNA